MEWPDSDTSYLCVSYLFDIEDCRCLTPANCLDLLNLWMPVSGPVCTFNDSWCCSTSTHCVMRIWGLEVLFDNTEDWKHCLTIYWGLETLFDTFPILWTGVFYPGWLAVWGVWGLATLPDVIWPWSTGDMILHHLVENWLHGWTHFGILNHSMQCDTRGLATQLWPFAILLRTWQTFWLVSVHWQPLMQFKTF